MKTSSVGYSGEDGYAITKGHKTRRASAAGIRVSDSLSAEVILTTDQEFFGADVQDRGNGLVRIVIKGNGSSFTNNSGGGATAVNYGDVVVIQTDGTITTTTTQQDTRPVGVVQQSTDGGALAPIIFSGYVAQVNTTGTVNSGDYLETSTTAGKADGNATQRSGSFARALAAGPNPPALLFGNTYLTGASGAGTFGWFNVKDPAYGATGNGSTDDTAAINLAIAALNAAGTGVLYFPATSSYYKTTAGLTAITAPSTILGDGSGSTAGAASTIALTAATGNILTLSHDNIRVNGLRLINNNGSESAGALIATTTGYGNHNRYEDLWFEGGYDCLSLIYGAEWAMVNCHVLNPVRYAVRVANIDLPDGGDWNMVDVWIGTRSRNATSGLRIESAGGGKIVNLKVNQNSVPDQTTYGGVKRYANGIDLAVGSSVGTADLLVANTSIENVTTGIKGTTSSGTSTWRSIHIVDVQIGTYTTGGSAISLVATTLADFNDVLIDDVTLYGAGGNSNPAIQLTNVDRARVQSVLAQSFASLLATTTCTNVIDGTGAVSNGVVITNAPTGSGQVPISTSTSAATWQAAPGGGVTALAAPAFTLGTSNVAGSATTVAATDSTIAAFDATTPAAIGTAATGSVAKAARRDHVHATGAGTPSTQALGDAASTGSGPAAAMTDHKHAMPALSTATPLIESGTGSAGTASPSSREDHVHPAATSSSSGAHSHVAGEQHLSDGSTTTYTLDEYFEPGSVEAFNVTTFAWLTVTEVAPDQAIVSAAGSSGDKIVFNYAASVV